MKKNLFKGIGAVVLGSFLLTGCSTTYHAHRPVVVTPTGDVFVPDPPPAPRSEDMGAPPANTDVWVPGYYSYNSSHWVWIPGHWQTPPRSGTTWVAGHWDHTVRGWFWTPGHWE